MSTQIINSTDAFDEYERDGYFIREPATNLAGLRRSIAVGDCVEPLLTQGDIVYIDEHSPPQSGDLAYFQWPKSVIDRWNASDKKADWVRQFGEADFSRGIKLFKEYNPPPAPAFANMRLLIARDGLRELDGHKMLGRVVAVEREGEILTGDIVNRSAVSAASIDANAVSTITSAYGAGPTICAYTSSPTLYALATSTVTTTGGPIAIDASASLLLQFSLSYTLNTLKLYVTRDGTAITSSSWDGSAYTGATALGNIPVTLTLTDTASAGNHVYKMILELQGTNSSTGSFQVTGSQLFLKVREIKK